jgi:hypothetical protein
MAGPVRLQLSRRAGFRLQEHSLTTNGLSAIKVARPGKWGNPFTVSGAIESGYATEATAHQFVVECFADWLAGGCQGRDWWQGPESEARREAILDALPELRGKNVACFCKEGLPCHGDVLIALANA